MAQPAPRTRLQINPHSDFLRISLTLLCVFLPLLDLWRGQKSRYPWESTGEPGQGDILLMSQPALDPRNSREKMDFLKETIPKISIPIQKLSELRRGTRRVEERDPHRPVSSHSASITSGPSTTGILQDSLRSFSSVLVQSALVQTSFNLHKNCPECATAKEINGIVFISFYPSFFCAVICFQYSQR